MRHRLICLMLTLFISSTQTQAQTSTSLDLERIQRATVFVLQVGGPNLSTRCVGTGTIVRYDGLILTNAHSTVTSAACPGSELIIAMSLEADEPPVPKYRADIEQVDEGLDLALLRITRELDGRLIEPGTLPVLPFVEVADSNATQLDDTITVVGYPSLGNDGVTATRGTISSFISEPISDRAWLKMITVEPVTGTMSGGGAYNQDGLLIGVPTTAPTTLQGEVGACRLLEDTNGDGFINNNDACVPVGDNIDVLRPASFARPLIRSASLGLAVETITAPAFQATASDAATINGDRMFFAVSVNNGLPTQVIRSAPAGTSSLYLFFDYRNFTPQTTYELRVNVGGVPNTTFSLPPVRWSGSSDGLWYIGSSGQTWPNGTYEFRLFIDGLAAGSARIVVGGIVPEAPVFSNVVFGLIDDNNNLLGDSYILPTGNIAYARFIYRNLQPNINWTTLWYYNDTPLPPQADIWSAEDGVSASRNVSIEPQGGLQPGRYRVELYVEDPETQQQTLSTMGDFIVAGAPTGVLPQVFSEPEFIRVGNTFEQPTADPASTFPDGAAAVFVRFDWQQIAPGTLWTMQLLVDEGVFYEETVPWRTIETGEDFLVRLSAPDGIPDGTYTFNLLINGVLLQSETFSVGIGQLEIDRFDTTGGTLLTGQIVDSATGLGISGATFILITEDFSIADFVWDSNQVYATAITDSNGFFEVDRPLEFESPYSVYIIAESFLPITADGFLISEEFLQEEGGSPLDMYIPLTRE